MRTLTIYVVRHDPDAPLAVFPTQKEANAYSAKMQEDSGACHNWRIDPITVNDNSNGAANMCNAILSECSDDLCEGYNAEQELKNVRKWLAGVLEAGAIQLTRDDDWPRFTTFLAGGSPLATDLEVGTPERIH